MPLRSKNIYKLCDIHAELEKLTERTLKNNKKAMTAPVPNMKENNDTYFAVEYLLFFRYTKGRNLLYIWNYFVINYNFLNTYFSRSLDNGIVEIEWVRILLQHDEKQFYCGFES